MTSVNTNVGALVALQNLRDVNTRLDVVQKRISTGERIADAKDDGASFAIAEGLRSDLKAYEAVDEQLSKAKGILEVSLGAAEAVSKIFQEAEAVLVKLADDSVTGDARTRYDADLARLNTEIGEVVSKAVFNGVNLVDSTAGAGVYGTKNIIASIDGTTTVTLTQQPLEGTNAGLAVVADAAAAKTLLAGDFATQQTAVGAALASLGQDVRSINKAQDFNMVLKDATDIGLGAIVDADLAKESAKLQSIQIQQQLATQSLGIANQAPSVLLSLFR